MSSTTVPSANFQPILDAALDGYAKQTGIDLRNHPSADKLQNCATSEDVLRLLQDRESSFKDYRDKHRKLINCLRPVVRVVQAFSGVLEVAGLVPFQPTKAIFVSVDVLLAAAAGVSASYDALFDLFECVGNFLGRLHIYTEKIPLVPTMSDILVKIMTEVLGVLAVATKQIKQGRFTKFAKKLLGESEIEAILQRLDRLTVEEARMTAAHTFEVVHGLVNNLKVVIDDGKASSEDIRRALTEMQNMADDINKIKRDQLQEKIRIWLHQPDASINHNIALRQRHDGTAAWFTQGGTFKEWRTMGSLLWIHGKPGSGKSVMCSSIIQEIEALHDTGLASMTYFYCDFKDAKKQDVTGLLASFLAQLSAKSDPCYHIVAALYSKYDAGSRQPNEDALIECLKIVLQIEGQPPVYLIVDAVDECPNTSDDVVSPRDRVLTLVEDLTALHLPNLRICVTSRPEADIRASLESLASHIISLHDQSGQKNDIVDFVSFVVHSDRNMRKWRAEDKKLVIETLSQKADGMFRWIACQLAMLRRCLPGTIRRALDDLPRSLDETYERILSSIGEERWEHAQRLFQCLAESFRPLGVDELAEILAIQFDAGTLPNYDLTLRPEDSEEAVLSTCSSLVAIVDVNGSAVVQFSHFSVKEYLTSERLANAGKRLSRYRILPESAHTVLAQASLGVLFTLDDEVDKNRVKDFPLALYAARHWVDHAQVGNVLSKIEDAMKLLFDPTKSHFARWVWIYDIDYPFREILSTDHPTPPDATPLYYTTLCGFHGVAEWLIVTCPEDVDTKGGYYSTPLHAAIAKGNLDIARVLLAHNVNVSAFNDGGMTPLHSSSRRGYCDAVELLLKYRADINLQDGTGQTSLKVASRYGQRKVVHLLVQNGAVVDIVDNDGVTPLMSASRYGYPDIARFLLQSGAAVDSRDKNGWTPLTSASRNGYSNIVRLLLQSGAAVDSRENDGWTPLKLASKYGYSNIVRLLLQSGAAVDSRDNDSWTPLMSASQSGHSDIVRLLLQSGATVDICNNRGWTLLMLASQTGYLDVVRLLLQNGTAVWPHEKCDLPCGGVHAQETVQPTPLHIASAEGHLDVAELLISYGADCEKLDQYHASPLHVASNHGELDIARLLLKSSSSPNGQDNEGWTPLHRASQGGNLQIVRLLFESGAEVNIRNNENQTAFDVARSGGKLEVAKFLAECMGEVDFQDSVGMMGLDAALLDGVDPRLGDEKGERPESEDNISLRSASDSWDVAAMQSLLDGGMDVNKRDVSHKTPLHHASSQGRFEVAKLLIKHGANLNSRDKFGSTPLHKASESGHLDVAQLLLDNGADANVMNQNQWMPLHLATTNCHLDIVRLLLERGANVHTRNGENRSAYELASRRSEPEIVQLLLKYGALAT